MDQMRAKVTSIGLNLKGRVPDSAYTEFVDKELHRLVITENDKETSRRIMEQSTQYKTLYNTQMPLVQLYNITLANNKVEDTLFVIIQIIGEPEWVLAMAQLLKS